MFEFMFICFKNIIFVIGVLKVVIVVNIGFVGVMRVYVVGVFLLYNISVLFMMLWGFFIGIFKFWFVKFCCDELVLRFLSNFVRFLNVYVLNFVVFCKLYEFL